jgi:hypothetical protein
MSTTAQPLAETRIRLNGDTSTVQLLTKEQALEWVKKAPRGASFNLHVRINAYCADDDEHYFPGAITGGVRITGREAISFIQHGMTDVLEGKGGRYRCTHSVWTSHDGKKRHHMWLG